jgi:tetratricopeptide (TPR) repeat protein
MALTGLFNILSLLYIFRSLQLGATVWRERATLRQDPLTRRKKQLAEQASFFLAVPVGVLLHELGHALAVWGAGGTVVEFGYRAFWGYVVPQGQFTLGQYWLIGVAGTLGSLLFGLSVWWLLRRHAASTLRYFGLRAFRFQVYFSLIYYPIFTLLGFEGDWAIIYDFRATPLLSSATAVSHAAILLLFWYGDRIGWFEAVSFETAVEQQRYAALAGAVTASADPQEQLALIDALRRGGAANKAKTSLRQLLRVEPHNAAAHLQLAAVYSDGKAQIPRQARASAQRALDLGLPHPRQTAFAHQLLGRYYLDVNRSAEAAEAFTEALTAVSSAAEPDPALQAHLHHLRSQAYRRQQQYERAAQDIEQAIHQAQLVGDETAVAHYRDEQSLIAQHAQRPLRGR